MRKLILAGCVGAALTLIGLAPALLAQPGPPSRYYGTLTIDGLSADANVKVVALVGGKDCSSYPDVVAGFGRYVIDVASGGQIPGCAGPGSEITFQVNGRAANEKAYWEGGIFHELNLTVGGATATPTPTPTPTPAPPATRYSLARLDFNAANSRCIPAAGEGSCTSIRQELWNGSQVAWTAEFERQGRPAPTPDEVFVATYEFRIGAGDPAAVASVAQGLGWPKIYVSAIRFRGSGPAEADEYVEIRNVGGAAQDMTGWRLQAVETRTDFFLSDGTVLEPGAYCRFYTGQTQDDSCPGTINVATAGVWNDDAGTAELWYDPLILLADRTQYNADPNNQPVPPNVRGVSAAG